MSGRQLLDWHRFAEQSGLGIDRDDIHWGMLLSMLYNIHRGSGAPKLATDFMPYRVDEEPDETFLLRLQHVVAVIKGMQT